MLLLVCLSACLFGVGSLSLQLVSSLTARAPAAAAATVPSPRHNNHRALFRLVSAAAAPGKRQHCGIRTAPAPRLPAGFAEGEGTAEQSNRLVYRQQHMYILLQACMSFKHRIPRLFGCSRSICKIEAFHYQACRIIVTHMYV